MNNKTTLYVIIGTVVLLFFLVGAYMLTNNSGPSSTGSYPNITKINPKDHIKWSSSKKNILVEYSDFECPSCKNFHDVLKTFEASGSPDFKITQKITFVMRDFPLFQIHPNAMNAAYAAEAAGKQGKYFEMTDQLFVTQDQWAGLPDPKDFFSKLAQQISLNIDQFKSDMNSNDVKQKVNDDITSGNSGNVDATPTFFLNGEKLDNVQSFDQFKQLLLKQQ